MKKSSKILMIILSLFIILPTIIIYNVGSEVKTFVNSNKDEKKLTKKIELPKNLRAIVLKKKSDVLLESNESKNSITIANSDTYTIEGDTLYLDTKTKNTKLNLTTYSYVELNDDSSLSIGKVESKIIELRINLKDFSKFKIKDLYLEKFRIDASDKARVYASNIRCDSLFLVAKSNASVNVRDSGRIKYFLGEIKDVSKVKIPTAYKMEVETENTAELKVN